MDFIALHEWRTESGRWRMGIAQTELHLTGHLLSRHAGTDGQQPQSRQAFDVPLHMLRVEHLLPHHLIAAADTHHGGTFTVGTDDGSRHTVTA